MAIPSCPHWQRPQSGDNLKKKKHFPQWRLMAARNVYLPKIKIGGKEAISYLGGLPVFASFVHPNILFCGCLKFNRFNRHVVKANVVVRQRGGDRRPQPGLLLLSIQGVPEMIPMLSRQRVGKQRNIVITFYKQKNSD